MSVLLVGAGCLLAGFLLGWFLARARAGKDIAEAVAGPRAEIAEAKGRLEGANQRAVDAQATLAERDKTLTASQEEIARLRDERGQLDAALKAERESSAQKEALLGEATTKLREAFQALAAEALKTNNQSFLELARASLGQFQEQAKAELDGKHKAVEEVIRPIQESLGKVETKLQEVEKERQTAYTLLTEQVRAMATGQQQLQSETANLVKALRSPTVRGRWGEIQLKRVVELAGMLDHCDFFEQEGAPTDAGRLRPDVIVKLPGGKNIVVDSKAPLAAYLEALEATDETVREARLRDHARQVRDHMTKLAAKSYWEQFQPSPELVVMFLPGETFFSAALQYDPTLIEYGVEQRVIPASPTTLISLLRAVHYGWRQEKLAENAQAISDLGRELYERIATWLEHFSKVGKGLSSAVTGYNSAVGSLESRVLVSARKFQELGGSTTRDLPEAEVVDQAVRDLQAEEVKTLPEPTVPPPVEPSLDLGG